MARMQFNPAARQRGFRKTTLSKGSIARMREESNRVVSHMEKLQQAKEAQANRDAAAMKENAEFTLRQMEENHQIKLRNLGVEGDRIRGEAEAKRRQQEIDNKQMTAALEGLVNFVPKAADYIVEKKEQYIQELIEKANDEAEPHNYSLYSEEHKEAERARANRDQAGELYDADIEEQHASGGMSLTDKLRGTASNPAVHSKVRQSNTNREFINVYNNTRSQIIRENIEITTKSGLTFNAVDALSNDTLERELHRHLLSKGLNFFNVKRSYVGEALDILNKRHEVNVQRAERKAADHAIELNIANADQLFAIGDTTSILQGMQILTRTVGPAAMHDRVVELGSDLSIDLEQLDQANPRADGKRYSEVWPNRWKKIQQNRLKAERALEKAERQETEVLLQAWAVENYDNIRVLMDKDPESTMAALQQRYGTTTGKPVPSIFKTMYTNALEDRQDILENELEQRIRFGILDLNYVNNIDNPEVQKKAKIALEAQEEAKYGPEALGIKESLRTTARQLTKLNPNEQTGSPQTFLVEARLKQEYLRLLKVHKDPILAKEKLEELVDAGAAGEDKSNPFYQDLSGPNNRPVFTNIERSDPERVERLNYVNKQMVSMGAEVVKKPFALANTLEMDATYQSFLSGKKVHYPIGILEAAEKLNLKPSEIYNAQRQANNKASGTKKPLIQPSQFNTIKTVDDVSPDIRKLILSDIPALIRRGGAQQSKTVSQYRRPSMGGGGAVSQRQALQDVAAELGVDPIDLATIIGFETGGSYSPDQVGGEGNNYMGLIQFGIPERRKYGVTKGMSFEDQLRGPVLKFFKDRFAGVGMSTQGATLEDLYTTVLAGNPKANRDAADSFGTTARSGAARMSKEHRAAAMQRFGF
jgi:hypothetical protein